MSFWENISQPKVVKDIILLPEGERVYYKEAAKRIEQTDVT